MEWFNRRPAALMTFTWVYIWSREKGGSQEREREMTSKVDWIVCDDVPMCVAMMRGQGNWWLTNKPLHFDGVVDRDTFRKYFVNGKNKANFWKEYGMRLFNLQKNYCIDCRVIFKLVTKYIYFI